MLDCLKPLSLLLTLLFNRPVTDSSRATLTEIPRLPSPCPQKGQVVPSPSTRTVTDKGQILHGLAL